MLFKPVLTCTRFYITNPMVQTYKTPVTRISHPVAKKPKSKDKFWPSINFHNPTFVISFRDQITVFVVQWAGHRGKHKMESVKINPWRATEQPIIFRSQYLYFTLSSGEIQPTLFSNTWLVSVLMFFPPPWFCKWFFTTVHVGDVDVLGSINLSGFKFNLGLS